MRTAPTPNTAVSKFPASYIEIIFDTIRRSDTDNELNEFIPGSDAKCYLSGTFSNLSGTNRPERRCTASSLRSK